MASVAAAVESAYRNYSDRLLSSLSVEEEQELTDDILVHDPQNGS